MGCSQSSKIGVIQKYEPTEKSTLESISNSQNPHQPLPPLNSLAEESGGDYSYVDVTSVMKNQSSTTNFEASDSVPPPFAATKSMKLSRQNTMARGLSIAAMTESESPNSSPRIDGSGLKTGVAPLNDRTVSFKHSLVSQKLNGPPPSLGARAPSLRAKDKSMSFGRLDISGEDGGHQVSLSQKLKTQTSFVLTTDDDEERETLPPVLGTPAIASKKFFTERGESNPFTSTAITTPLNEDE